MNKTSTLLLVEDHTYWIKHIYELNELKDPVCGVLHLTRLMTVFLPPISFHWSLLDPARLHKADICPHKFTKPPQSSTSECPVRPWTTPLLSQPQTFTELGFATVSREITLQFKSSSSVNSLFIHLLLTPEPPVKLWNINLSKHPDRLMETPTMLTYLALIRPELKWAITDCQGTHHYINS